MWVGGAYSFQGVRGHLGAVIPDMVQARADADHGEHGGCHRTRARDAGDVLDTGQHLV